MQSLLSKTGKMKSLRGAIWTMPVAGWLIASGVIAESASPEDSLPVTSPPNSFFQLLREADREVARQFYKKYADVKGMPVAASAEVADEALRRTYSIVTHLL